MNDNLEKTLERLTNENYIVAGKETELRKQLTQANRVIKDFVSKFDNPHIICPELVEYLRIKR